MTTLKHGYTNPQPDDGDPNVTGPYEWNDDHISDHAFLIVGAAPTGLTGARSIAVSGGLLSGTDGGAGAAYTVGLTSAAVVAAVQAAGQALSRTNDTNVTLTLAGSPTTALLAATSLTLGWTGLLSLARGGTHADLSATGGTGQYLKQASVGADITVGTIAAADLPGTFSGFANPSASIGLSAVNGSATTAMRSDAAPSLSQSIAPTWTGLHKWSATLGVTPDDTAAGIQLVTAGTAAAGAQQISPSLHFKGSGWKTNATAGAQTVEFRNYLLPIQGTSAADVALVWEVAVGGSYVEAMRYQYANHGAFGVNGYLTVNSFVNALIGFQVAGAATSGNVLRGQGTYFTSDVLQASDIGGGAALTRTNDTNVTLTLGGTPTTALLAAASLTLGWTGLLGLARGGTHTDLSATGGTGQYLKQAGAGSDITVGTIAAADLPANGANPSASVGLSAVNGSATTWMRSDAAPPLSQAITPSWANPHTWSTNGLGAVFTAYITISNATAATSGVPLQLPGVISLAGTVWNTSGTPASNTMTTTIGLVGTSGAAPSSRLAFRFDLNGGGFTEKGSVTSAGMVSAAVGFLVNLSAPTAGHYLRGNGTAFVDGTIAAGDLPANGANPSASVGLTAVNGSATTWMRSDAAPALSVAITPTWTGLHTWSGAAIRVGGTGGYISAGSTSAPSNVTSGDITGLRGHFGTDAAFGTGATLENLAGVFHTGYNSQGRPASDDTNGGLAVTWNHSGGTGGTGEVDLWNVYDAGGLGGFVFKQKTGAATHLDVFYITSTGSGLIPGYFRIGSITAAPTNVTAGDLTVIRGHFGTDAAFTTGAILESNAGLVVHSQATGSYLLYMNGTGTGATNYGWYVDTGGVLHLDVPGVTSVTYDSSTTFGKMNSIFTGNVNGLTFAHASGSSAVSMTMHNTTTGLGAHSDAIYYMISDNFTNAYWAFFTGASHIDGVGDHWILYNLINGGMVIDARAQGEIGLHAAAVAGSTLTLANNTTIFNILHDVTTYSYTATFRGLIPIKDLAGVTCYIRVWT